MNDTEFENYKNLEDYFKDHPEEEAEYIEEMREQLDIQMDEMLDMPEDWKVYA